MGGAALFPVGPARLPTSVLAKFMKQPFLGIQQPLECGISYPKLLCSPAARNITLVKALQNISKTTGEALSVCNPGTPYPMALFTCPVHACLDPLPQDPLLQLDIGYGDVVEGLAEGGGGILLWL